MRSGAELHGRVVGAPVEIEKHGLLFALRQNAGEVDGQRCRAGPAFHAQERIDFSELAGVCRSAAGSLFETRHGIAEFDALDRLDEKIVGAGAKRADHEVAVAAVVRGDHVEIRGGLLYLFERLQAGVRIVSEIDDERRFGVPLQVLKNTYIKVGVHLRVFRENLRVLHVQKIFADHLAEVVVGGGNEQ